MSSSKILASVCLVSALSVTPYAQANKTVTESPFASSAALTYKPERDERTIWEKGLTPDPPKKSPVDSDLSATWASDDKNPKSPTELKKTKVILPPAAKPKTPPIKWDWKAFTAVALLQGSTIYDMETTFRTLDRCSRCKEGNPIMRPFIKAGRPATYAFTTGMNVLTTYVALNARAQGKKWWYWPIIANVAVHVVAGVHNSRIKSTILQPVASNLQ